MEKDNLKIEFRAVPYVHETKVLEYRISPEQDLTYYDDVNLLWGLIKFKRKKKYSTKWKQVQEFHCSFLSQYNDVYHWLNYVPIWCNNQETLNWFKRTFETYGAFEKYVADRERAEYEKYWLRREKHIKDAKEILY